MENNLPKIYPKNSILGFSIFMSVIFGGVLLFFNLIAIKKKKEAYCVLGISILLAVLSILIINVLETPNGSLAYIFGLFGGGILSFYFVPKYFPDEDQYPKKSLWRQIIIALIIMIIIVYILLNIMIHA